MFKNSNGQAITLLAIDTATGLPKTGDASNITLYVSIDDGSVTLISTGSGVPSEVDATNDPGAYLIALVQAETNGNKLRFSGKSSTSGVVIVAQTVYTTPPNFSLLNVDGSGSEHDAGCDRTELQLRVYPALRRWGGDAGRAPI